MQVKTKNVAVIALGVLLVLVLWNRVVYSPMSNQATKAKQATQDAQLRVDTLQRQLRQETGGGNGQAKKASAGELQHAIPVTPELSNFLRTTDKIRAQTGVGFQSITPSVPTVVGGVQTINLGIVVQGEYRQVLAYLDALMKTPRLVIVDNVGVTGGGASGSPSVPGSTGGGPTGEVFAGVGAAPSLQVQLNTRLFAQAPAGLATGSTSPGAAGSTTRTPAGGPTSPPPGVANG